MWSTKLNCPTTVSPRTSTLHFSAISVYICVFPLPPSTCLRSSVSLSFVVLLLLLLPSSSFFFIHFNELNPTFLTRSSILYTCQSRALPITFLLNQWLLSMSIRTHPTCQFSFALEFEDFSTRDNWQVTEPMSTLFSFQCVCGCVLFFKCVCLHLGGSPPRGGGVPLPF